MIFFWISLPIIYPMWSNKIPQALTWIGLLTITFTIVPFYVYDREFHGVPDSPPWRWQAPWTRFQPYLVGILLGYVLHKTRGKQVKIDAKLNLFLWQAAFLTAFACLYGTYKWNPSEATYVTYFGLKRLAWSAALAWVIFSCSRGHGGIVKDFLSWKLFAPLSRLTYSCYLIHMTIINADVYQGLNFTLDLSMWLMVVFFLGNLCLSHAIAVITSLAFEAPFIKLEKLVFGREHNKLKP